MIVGVGRTEEKGGRGGARTGRAAAVFGAAGAEGLRGNSERP
jgi:hypothetical protein